MKSTSALADYLAHWEALGKEPGPRGKMARKIHRDLKPLLKLEECGEMIGGALKRAVKE